LTHREWYTKVKRLLELSDTRPKLASQGFHRLARSVEGDLKKGLHEWHLVQSLHLASMAETTAGDHRSAADTLIRVVDRQRDLLAGELRAYVSACAAAAIELAKAGDLNAARRMVRTATPWADVLGPREKLLQVAKDRLRTRPRRSPALANERVASTAPNSRGGKRAVGRRGSRAGR
jgi:hypothetical protein